MSKSKFKMMPKAFYQGEIVPREDATVTIASHSLQYGTTCFGGMRGYVRGGVARIFRLEDHHARLMKACRILGFDYTISLEAFQKALADLVAANAPETDFYLRPFVYSADEMLGPRFDTLDYELAIYLVQMEHYMEANRGLNLAISSWRKFSDNAIPTKAKAGGAYLNSSLATTEAKANGFDEALVLDHAGYVVEGSVTNLICVYRGEVFIPPVGSAVLDGITSRTAVDLLREQGIPIRFEHIDRSMLYTCDELILTGTAAQLVYAASADRRPIGDGSPGPICTMLREQFERVLAGDHPRSPDWLTPI